MHRPALLRGSSRWGKRRDRNDMKRLLLPLSWLYGAVVVCRNLAFDWGWLKSEEAGVPVISVGNMTAGGTGKTPLVEYLVRQCEARGKRVGVVSRGYGRRTSGLVVVSDGNSLLVDAAHGGDEPVQIARKNPKAVVVVGENKVSAARFAARTLGAEVVLLDDGFQHRYLRRRMDIVVIDSMHNLSQESMLPAGFRREPLAGLGRATLLAFSNLKEPDVLTSLQRDLDRWYVGPAIGFRHRSDGLFRSSDHTRVNPGTLRATPVLAFSGIGNHDRFVEGLKEEGFTVRDDIRFPDHHVYTGTDCNRLARRMKDAGAELCVTTEKDVVRMKSGPGESFPASLSLHYVSIEVEIVRGEDVLRRMIDRYLAIA